MCNGTTCSGTFAADRYGGDCDPDGCDWNPYRNGATDFFGPGLTVDTNKVITVVTQFLTDAAGNLNNVVRYYVQNGVLIGTPQATNIPGFTGNSITPSYCPAQHSAFGETDYFTQKGGFANVQAGFEAGMVLVLSLWDDVSATPFLFSTLTSNVPFIMLLATNHPLSPALRQHALAGLDLPHHLQLPRCGPRQLRDDVRRAQRRRKQPSQRQGHLQQHPIRQHQQHLHLHQRPRRRLQQQQQQQDHQH